MKLRESTAVEDRNDGKGREDLLPYNQQNIADCINLAELLANSLKKEFLNSDNFTEEKLKNMIDTIAKENGISDSVKECLKEDIISKIKDAVKFGMNLYEACETVLEDSEDLKNPKLINIK